MKKEKSIFCHYPLMIMTLLVMLITGCKKDNATGPVLSAPVISTLTVRAITLTSAITGGNITSDGGAALTVRGLCYSMEPNPTILNSVITDGSVGIGTFSSTLTGLTRGTKYYVRAYATNSVGTAYGEEIGFSTIALTPTITTTAVSSVATTTAVTGGVITDDGGSTITARGVCWSIADTLPTVASSSLSNGMGMGSFTSTLTVLTMNTTYYLRAYATNSAGTSYGSTIYFTTKGYPVLITGALSMFKGTQATSACVLTCEGGFTVTARGVCWSTSANPTLSNSYVRSSTATETFSCVLINLTPGTIYHVRAYATNSVGTGYGNDLSFNPGQVLGSNYAGGLVLYNNGNGGGLVCAGTDQAGTDQSGYMPWGCSGTYITLTDSVMGSGQANTTAIVNNCSTAGTAARICNDLVINSYSDWFLPSKTEMALVQALIQPPLNVFYWTSSEVDASNAYCVGTFYLNPSGGAIIYPGIGGRTPEIRSKSGVALVRAVRVF